MAQKGTIEEKQKNIAGQLEFSKAVDKQNDARVIAGNIFGNLGPIIESNKLTKDDIAGGVDAGLKTHGASTDAAVDSWQQAFAKNIVNTSDAVLQLDKFVIG